MKIESKIIRRKSKGSNVNIQKINKLAPPITLSAVSGDIEGEIILLWEPVAGAKTYMIQKSKGTKIPVRWKQEDVVAKSFYTASKLKSNVKYWFKVAAVGSGGQGFWSEAIQKKAP